MTQQTDAPDQSTGSQAWQAILAGAALGAAAMFMLDPDRGRRRRKQTGQALRRIGKRSGSWLETSGRDAGHRWQGVLAQLRRLLGGGASPSDPQLQARVRARLGRLVSHPHAIEVTAHDGSVTLGGPILAHEQAALLADVARIPGVREVLDQLQPHAHADGIPALQGEGHAAKVASPMRSLPPAWRGLALAGGGALAWYGLSKRSALGAVLGTIGLAVLAGSAAAPRTGQRQRHLEAGSALPPDAAIVPPEKVLH